MYLCLPSNVMIATLSLILRSISKIKSEIYVHLLTSRIFYTFVPLMKDHLSNKMAFYSPMGWSRHRFHCIPNYPTTSASLVSHYNVKIITLTEYGLIFLNASLSCHHNKYGICWTNLYSAETNFLFPDSQINYNPF